jgi:hypothetical protein
MLFHIRTRLLFLHNMPPALRILRESILILGKIAFLKSIVYFILMWVRVIIRSVFASKQPLFVGHCPSLGWDILQAGRKCIIARMTTLLSLCRAFNILAMVQANIVLLITRVARINRWFVSWIIRWNDRILFWPISAIVPVWPPIISIPSPEP